MLGVEALVADLKQHAIEGELWVDGSFLTQKVDAQDADVLLRVPLDFVDVRSTPVQKQVLSWVDSNLKQSHHCDSYVTVCDAPVGHPLHAHCTWYDAYWLRQFGFSRQSQPKGIAVIQLP